MSAQTTEDADGRADDIAASPLIRWAKVAIVVMGLLIVAGFVFIGVEIWRRQSDPDYAARVQERRGAVPAPAQMTTGGLALPAGARIVEQTAVGNRLAVRVDLPGGAQAVYMLGYGGRSVEILELVTAPAR